MRVRLLAVAFAVAAAGCTSTVPVPAYDAAGLPSGLALKSWGSVTVQSDGTVIEGVRFTGAVTVDARDVVIRRSVFEGDGTEPWAIRTVDGGSVTIEQVTIRGGYTDAGIAGNNWTARNVEVVGADSDGAKLGNHVTVAGCWFHDFREQPGGHIDGLQADEAYGNIVIEGNRIDVGTADGSNAAIMLSPDVHGESAGGGPVVVRGNILGGGGYTLYNVEGRTGKALPDVTVVDNEFLPGAQYGPIYPQGERPKVQGGNHFSDGTPIIWPG